METKSLDSYIEITPGVLSGKPRIAGRRIAVSHVAIAHNLHGQSPNEIAAEYQLSLVEIHAALAYYYKHRQEIDESNAREDQWFEEQKAKSPSKLQAILKRNAS